MNYQKIKIKKKIIIAIIISTIIIIGLAIFLVLFFTKKDDDEDEIINYYLYENLANAVNKRIINSFKKGGENYNEILGNINDGNDYEESERNNFDLCIPFHINKRKNRYNRILLYIHGGGWISGEKINVTELCQRYEKYDFISASMTYTIFNGTYNNTNMFRLIDEITYTMKAIKVFLKEKGFDENKFELALGGGSAGAHLSMLYSYMIKNPPIPIKFVYDNVGPVTIDPKYFFYTKIFNDSLENIEPEDIDKAFNESKLVSIDNISYGVEAKITFLSFMNLAIGRKFNNNFDKIFSDLKNGILNETSEEYKELLNKTAYAFPLIYVNKQSTPTLCIYGGQDEINGVAQYAQLKKKFIEQNNDNIELIYFKYGYHDVYEIKGENYEKAYSKEYERFDYFSQKYFTKDNNLNIIYRFVGNIKNKIIKIY